MGKDILTFINGIKANTDISITVFDKLGKVLVGDIAKTSECVFVEQDILQQNGKTFFSFKFKGVVYYACIDGDGEGQRSCAFLITQLANQTKNQDVTKEEFIQTLILGEADSSFIKKNVKRFNFYDKSLFVMIICPQKGVIEQLVDFVSSYQEIGDFYQLTEDNRIVFAKMCDQAVSDYFSSAQYAEYLARSIFEETGEIVKIGVGGIVSGLDKVNISYNQALSTVDMMDVLQSNGNVHTYKEYLLIGILSELPKNKLNQYLNLLQDVGGRETFEDKEIMETAEAFLDNNLNASETSRKMYLHRNTLSYRLDKIEKTTGLNIRKFSDAVAFRIVTILLKLTRWLYEK